MLQHSSGKTYTTFFSSTQKIQWVFNYLNSTYLNTSIIYFAVVCILIEYMTVLLENLTESRV